MEDEPLLLPLVLPGNTDIIAEACNSAKVTALTGWKPSSSDGEVILVAMGCENGSIFVFGPDITSSIPDASPTMSKPSAQRPTSPRPSVIANLTRFHGPPSPSLSSAGSSYFKSTVSTKPTTLQPSKSRVQAGVSKEQVEAPKNYVDYDDEPAKLKSLLKAREPVKDRGLLDNLIPALHIGHHHHHRGASSDNASQPIDKQSSYSRISTHPSSTSTSPPASPTTTESQRRVESHPRPAVLDNLVLKVHVTSPRLAFGRSVTAIAYLEQGLTFASLQECGTLCLFSSADGACLSSIQVTLTSSTKPPAGMPAVDGSLKGVWSWCKMVFGSVAETKFLFLAAADITTNWDEPAHKTRVAIIKVKSAAERDSSVTSEYLTKIGEWVVDSAVNTVGMAIDSAGVPVLYHTASNQQLIIHKMQILDKIKLHVPVLEEEASGSSIGLPLTTIPIPNPFKSRRPRAVRPKSIYDVRKNEEGLVDLERCGDPIDLGISGADEATIVLRDLKDGQPIIVYTSTCAKIFVVQNGTTAFVEEVKMPNISNAVIYANGTFSLCAEDKNSIFRLGWGQDESRHLVSLPGAPSTANAFTTVVDDCILMTSTNARGLRRIHVATKPEDKSKKLWKSRAVPSSYHITSLLPIDLTTIILGYDDGLIRRASLSQALSSNEGIETYGEPSDQSLDGRIVHMSIARNERSGEYLIVGGTDGGVVAVWTLQSLRLVARWTLFATPLVSVIRLSDDAVGRLRGGIMCIANGGTAALLLLDSLEIAFTIPGGPARLEKVCLGEDNLMLIYANDTVRLWDIKTQEFWRSMSRDKAEELLEQGGWFECLVEPGGPSFATPALGNVEKSFTSPDTSRTMVFDLRHILSAEPMKSPQLATGQSELYKLLLSHYLTTGIDDNIDKEVVSKLEIATIRSHSGLCGFSGAASLFNYGSPSSAWTISPVATATRLLAICSVLRACASVEGMDEHVNTVSMYYTTSLHETVGIHYQSPSLSTLAKFWFDSNVDIRTSARNIFDATVGQMDDEAVVATVEEFRHRLPCLQPDLHKESPWAVVSLLIVGNIAIARHAALSPSVVTDVATSISMFLHDESSAHRVLGIDLSSRGLQIWQTYTDTMEILRSLFDLASTTRKDADTPSIRNEATQARLAVLHVATTCTHLFMTKLLLDVTQPRTPAHGRSIMQLLAFLIRKKPLVLYHNIPRLMEAVVKCIDPNSALRETVIDAVTGILSEVVRVYPTVDFHPATQKLVVGTNEGAAILYDLKTATRLYVLEGHKKRISACTFSPDGRRLVTVSLEESVVMVWKVGSSFTSFFYPGAPPRQGHSGSEPFKTLSFNVGSEAYMTTAATLEWLGFDWPGERNVRLRIRDSTLTFNT